MKLTADSQQITSGKKRRRRTRAGRRKNKTPRTSRGAENLLKQKSVLGEAGTHFSMALTLLH